MPLVDDIRGDIEAARRIRLPWWSLLCIGIGALLVACLLDHLGRYELVRPTLISTAVLGFAVVVKWNLRRRLWFWKTMSITFNVVNDQLSIITVTFEGDRVSTLTVAELTSRVQKVLHGALSQTPKRVVVALGYDS